MTDNPWAAWLREQEGAQVLPGGAAAAGPSQADEPGGPDELHGGPFGWDLPPQPRRPARHLLLAAVVLWFLLLVAAVSLLTRGEPAAQPTAELPATPADEGSAPDQALRGAGDGSTSGDAAAAGPGAPGAPGTAGEAGVLLVRAALGAPGAGGVARYVDAAVVAGVEPVGGAQVVTVLALVLRGDGQGWDTATVERHAVAVAPDPGGSYRAVAGPWPLAPPAPADPPGGTPETDPERLALAAAALETAGYRDLTGLSLLRDPTHPGVLTARATATAPGAAEPLPWTLWLRDSDDPTLLGTDRKAPR